MSDAAPDDYLPSGPYFVTNRGCPLVPVEPGSTMTIPLNPMARQTWKLQQLMSIPEKYIYILSNEEETLYLGTTTQPNPRNPDEGPVVPEQILPVFATTTRNKDEAWRFKLEQLYYTQVNGSPAEFPGIVNGRYILVQVKHTGHKQVLTVKVPKNPHIGIIGTVKVEEALDGEEMVDYIWGVEQVLRGPTPAA